MLLSATAWYRNHDENKEFWLVYIFILTSLHALKLLYLPPQLTSTPLYLFLRPSGLSLTETFDPTKSSSTEVHVITSHFTCRYNHIQGMQYSRLKCISGETDFTLVWILISFVSIQGAFIFQKGGVGRRYPSERECKISQPSLYIFC